MGEGEGRRRTREATKEEQLEDTQLPGTGSKITDTVVLQKKEEEETRTEETNGWKEEDPSPKAVSAQKHQKKRG